MKTPVLIVMILFSLSGCVMKKTFVAKEAELATSQTQLEKTQAALDEKTAALNRQKQESEALQAEISRLKGEVTVKSEQAQTLTEQTQTYDQLVGKLKSEIEQGKIKITQLENKLTVNLVDKVLFSSGEATLNEEGKATLTKVSEVLSGVTDKTIQVEGHTDNVPISSSLQRKFPTNWELSTARATEVVRFLVEKGEMSPENISAAGYSYYRPVADNATPEGKRENRRIEIVLVPKK
jgi:chemotaxis protein MotB